MCCKINTKSNTHYNCNLKYNNRLKQIKDFTIEIKFKRIDQNVINPKIPMFILIIVKKTQNAAIGLGIKINETITTAIPAIAIEESVPGKTVSYCSANLKKIFNV